MNWRRGIFRGLNGSCKFHFGTNYNEYFDVLSLHSASEAKAPKHINRSGSFLRRELVRFYPAIDTSSFALFTQAGLP